MAKINKTTISKLAEWLDELIKLKGLAEQLDGFAIKTALGFLNNKFGDKIPDELTPKIEGIIESVTQENYEDAEKQFAELLAGLIDTPLLDGTDEEIEAYESVISIIDTLVRDWLSKA